VIGMVNLPDYVDAIGVTLGLLGAAAFIFAYFRSEYTKHTITQLQDLSEALDKRLSSLEDERDILIEKVTKLEKENDVLRGLVTGESHFEKLLRVMDANHREIMVALGTNYQRKD